MRMHRFLPANSLGILRGPFLKYWNKQAHKVRENVEFKDIHKGETCFIFGNGGSLMFYDFSAIPRDIAVIGCNFGLLDSRLRHLNLKYYIWPDSYTLYPVVYNDYLDTLQLNYMPKLIRKFISSSPAVTFFTSITNSFAFLKKPANVRYWHHFGQADSSSVDLAGVFSTCTCALDQMIGIARYMGFSKALLLGCDYLGTPKMEGHFYANKEPVFGKDDPEYGERVKKSVGDLDIQMICPKGVSSQVFPSVQFEEYFRAHEVYQTNREIIDEDYVKVLKKMAEKTIIFI